MGFLRLNRVKPLLFSAGDSPCAFPQRDYTDLGAVCASSYGPPVSQGAGPRCGHESGHEATDRYQRLQAVDHMHTADWAKYHI